MRVRPLLLHSAAIALGSACAPSSTPHAAPAPARATAAAPERPAPAYGAACAPVIEHARRVPTEPLLTPPAVRALNFQAFTPPARLRLARYTLHVEVDSAGGVTAAHMEPAVDSAFTRQVLRAIKRTPFYPGLLHGCGVPARATVEMSFASGGDH